MLFTESRNGLKAALDGVVNDADTTVITCRDAEDAVIMSLDYYNSLMETANLLRSPQNADHLNRYRAGEITQRDLNGKTKTRKPSSVSTSSFST
ncbi:type II toxin-antitoxin system Phd/YefM family antitoxin [Vibrio brasiliensis]